MPVLSPAIARSPSPSRVEAPGRIATLIAPADTALGDADGVVEAAPPAPRRRVDASVVSAAARALTSGKPAMLMLGGVALRGKALDYAGRIAAQTTMYLAPNVQKENYNFLGKWSGTINVYLFREVR